MRIQSTASQMARLDSLACNLVAIAETSEAASIAALSPEQVDVDQYTRVNL